MGRILVGAVHEGGDGENTGDVPHNDSDGKCAFCLLAEPSDGAGVGDGAAFRDVPWRASLWVFWVTHVRPRLTVDADSVEGGEGSMNDEG